LESRLLSYRQGWGFPQPFYSKRCQIVEVEWLIWTCMKRRQRNSKDWKNGISLVDCTSFLVMTKGVQEVCLDPDFMIKDLQSINADDSDEIQFTFIFWIK